MLFHDLSLPVIDPWEELPSPRIEGLRVVPEVVNVEDGLGVGETVLAEVVVDAAPRGSKWGAIAPKLRIINCCYLTKKPHSIRCS